MKKIFIYIGLMITFTILIGCPGNVDGFQSKELSGGYIYHEPSGLPCIEKEHSGKGIPGLIYAYDYNSKFIIALAKDLKLPESKRNELVAEGDFYDYVNKKGYSKYWIIILANDSIYGPFELEEFLIMRQELGVSNDLQLNE
jgi:hypothetical protein